jgi:hypothetical protein
MNEMDREQRAAIANYLKGEFLKFQSSAVGRAERIPSQKRFAVWLGLDPTIFSYVINEERMPTQLQADLINTKLGPKIYELTGYAPRVPNDPGLRLIVNRWHLLSKEKKHQLTEIVENATFDTKGDANTSNATA